MLCCEDATISMDFSKIEAPPLLITWDDSNMLISALFIIFNPLYWNLVARWEYRNRWLTRICGSALRGCILLAITIVLLGIHRDWRFKVALQSGPKWRFLQNNQVLVVGYCLISLGQILVLTSFWALGFTGTFLGDYFGILLPKRITCFPFNIIDHPMYWGSTITFLGFSLVYASQVGLLLTLLVGVMYRTAIAYEEPFTDKIYKEKEKVS